MNESSLLGLILMTSGLTLLLVALAARISFGASLQEETIDSDWNEVAGLNVITPAALRMFSSGPKGFLARCAATWDADISRRVALERLYSQSRLFFVAKRVLEGALDLGDLRIAVEEHGALLEEKP